MENNRPTWEQLTPAQRKAAYDMNDDNFDQCGQSRAKEWEQLMDDMNDTERAEWLAEMNRQAKEYKTK